MAVTRRQQDQSEDKDIDSINEVYELPLSAGCRTTTTTPFCRYVPFMPCYNDRHIASRLRRAFGRFCRCCRPASDCV